MKIEKTERKEFFIKMYGVGTLEEVQQKFKKEYSLLKNNKKSLDKVLALFQDYHFSIIYLYTASTIKKNLSSYRNIIKEEGGVWEKMLLESFLIPKLSKALIDMSEQKTEEEIITSSDINIPKTISDIKKLLTLSNEELSFEIDIKKNQKVEQVRAYYLVILMGLSGGRRLSELLAKSSITKKGSVYFHNGILKKKGNDNLVKANLLDLSIEDYKKYQKELKAYSRKRVKATANKTLATVSEKELNLIFDKVFNNAIKRISPSLTGVLIPNVHELRHHFTVEHQARHLTENPHLKNLSEDELEKHLKSFRYEILGHEEKKDSSATYNSLKNK